MLFISVEIVEFIEIYIYGRKFCELEILPVIYRRQMRDVL